MVSEICSGKVYCHRGIPMLKTRIQLLLPKGEQPAEELLSLWQLTERYAEQTLLPAIREAYDSLPSVAEKMHFEPYGYRHSWQAAPRSHSPDLLTVRIETELTHGGEVLRATAVTLRMDRESGRLGRIYETEQAR